MRTPKPVQLMPVPKRAHPSLVWRIEYFLRSPRNLLGMVFGGAGALALAAGLPPEIAAVGLVGGLYSVGYLLARPRRVGALDAVETRETWRSEQASTS